ncbi:hypothetical protein [Sphaerisporangium perillae]|uniref:hypothetical protein n=1 Tax=Sphaerisporangium perillae TaxID=2935860 RepID=UPI002435BB7C|nr:hypothetical protein [Sphaerisporangium perillae]
MIAVIFGLVAVVLLVLVVVALGMRSMNRRESNLPPERLRKMAEQADDPNAKRPGRPAEETFFESFPEGFDAFQEPERVTARLRPGNGRPSSRPAGRPGGRPAPHGKQASSRGKRGVDEWGDADDYDDDYWSRVRADDGAFGGTIAARVGASRPDVASPSSPSPSPKAAAPKEKEEIDANAATVQAPLPTRPTGLAGLVEPARNTTPTSAAAAAERTVTFSAPVPPPSAPTPAASAADVLGAIGTSQPSSRTRRGSRPDPADPLGVADAGRAKPRRRPDPAAGDPGRPAAPGRGADARRGGDPRRGGVSGSGRSADTGRTDSGRAVPGRPDPLRADPLSSGPLAGPLPTGSLANDPLSSGPLSGGAASANPLAGRPRPNGAASGDPLATGPASRTGGPGSAGSRPAGPASAGPRPSGPLDAQRTVTGPFDAGRSSTGSFEAPRTTGSYETPRSTGSYETPGASRATGPFSTSGSYGPAGDALNGAQGATGDFPAAQPPAPQSPAAQSWPARPAYPATGSYDILDEPTPPSSSSNETWKASDYQLPSYEGYTAATPSAPAPSSYEVRPGWAVIDDSDTVNGPTHPAGLPADTSRGTAGYDSRGGAGPRGDDALSAPGQGQGQGQGYGGYESGRFPASDPTSSSWAQPRQNTGGSWPSYGELYGTAANGDDVPDESATQSSQASPSRGGHRRPTDTDYPDYYR